MSSIDPNQREIVQELWNRRDTLDPDKRAIVEELAGRLNLSTPTAAPAAQTSATPVNPTQTNEYQNIMGATPQDLAERFKGVGRAAGRAGMGFLQYVQYLSGGKVSPTPLSLEPSPDPNQHIGEAIGHAAMVTAPAMATAGASLPVQSAVGAAIGGSEGGPSGAVVGGAVPVAIDAAATGIKYLADKIDAARIFNRVAGVPAGRKGAETAMATGEIKTNPGNAPIRAMEGSTKLEQVKAALFARPTPELQTQVYGELQKAGKSLGDHLAKSNNVLDLSKSVDAALPKVQVALEEAGIAPDQLAAVTPTQAHAFRSKLGDLIPSSSWGQESPNPMTEQLKDIYFSVGDKIKSGVQGIAEYDKRWQEAYLYGRALKHQLDKVAAGTGRPLSSAQRGLIKLGGGIGALTAVEEGFRRMTKPTP